tara:strand:+ start:1500 stop:1649 length:150 start_codon:yes stop_codon:yes gene_type:complete
MGTKGIDQRPYDREKFNDNFDAIFGKKEEKKEEVKDGKPDRDENNKDRK